MSSKAERDTEIAEAVLRVLKRTNSRLADQLRDLLRGTPMERCDFGINHPVVGAQFVWDRDRDVIHSIELIKEPK